MDFKDQNIIFFDGDCNLCDRFVEFISRKDKKKLFLYAPLQGKIALNLLNKEDREELKYILFWRKGEIFRGSPALFEVMSLLYPKWVLVFRFLPMSFYSFLYHFISKNRYKIFGKKKK